ncbi:hypothetical protein [Zooshikella sp. RANM57]|uniref:hypothetical protein n=1 Tax=Zooshikella sp. RANM57 TaxID=3425863 RepID=UPI003D6DCC4D
MKKYISSIAISLALVGAGLSANSYSADPVTIRSASLVATTSGSNLDLYHLYLRDTGTKELYLRRDAYADWTLKSVGEGWFNIVSIHRPGGCIYDSSGSDLAKYDSSCNSDFPRAEWKLQLVNNNFKIVNKLGRCLELHPERMRLKAVACGPDNLQLFRIY